MSDYEIRLFQPGDRPMVEAFFDQMAPDSRSFFNRNNGNRNGAMRFFEGKDGPNVLRWAAVKDGDMIGYVFLWDTDTMIPWLGIAVSEKMRGKHFGEILIKTCEDWCRDHGKGGILLTTHMANVRAQTLYERCGFEKIGIHLHDNELLYLKRF